MKNQPTRTCMGCNEKKAKNDLIRIVKNKISKIDALQVLQGNLYSDLMKKKKQSNKKGA